MAHETLAPDATCVNAVFAPFDNRAYALSMATAKTPFGDFSTGPAFARGRLRFGGGLRS